MLWLDLGRLVRIQLLLLLLVVVAADALCIRATCMCPRKARLLQQLLLFVSIRATIITIAACQSYRCWRSRHVRWQGHHLPLRQTRHRSLHIPNAKLVDHRLWQRRPLHGSQSRWPVVDYAINELEESELVGFEAERIDEPARTHECIQIGTKETRKILMV